MHQTAEDIRELFASRNMRFTRQRERIYRALAEDKSHPTAEELFQVVRRDQPGMSLATVYNTLEALTGAGLARRVNAGAERASGPCRYDADVSEHAHVVLDDGSVRDLPRDLGGAVLGALSPELVRRIEARLGVRVERLNVDVVARRGG